MSSLLKLLAIESGLPASDLSRIISTAPERYKQFEIPKRTGGVREIAQPARELKLLQRILIEHVLEKLPVHECATAYRKGKGLLDNASPHAGTSPILKLDFKEFFPSIEASDWLKYAEANAIFDDLEDRRRAAMLLFRRRRGEFKLRLSIGAPSSPILSNILMYEFDREISRISSEKGIAYTRYADDLTFSGQRLGFLNDIPEAVVDVCKAIPWPTLSVNDQKTARITTASRRSVTGIVLANDSTVGLGRDRKRLLSAKVHNAIRGGWSKAELRSLAGELAFAHAVEPDFIVWLGQKYGVEKVAAIKRLKTPEIED